MSSSIFCNFLVSTCFTATDFFFLPLKLSATAEERADRSKLYKLMSVKDLQSQTNGPVSAGKNTEKVTLK